MVWRKTLGILTPLSILLLLASPAHAAIYCWKNNVAVEECAGSIPAEYSQKRIVVKRDNGTIIRIIAAAKTPAELERDRILKEKEAIKEAKRKKRERLDRILLDSYATERDLVLARDNNLNGAQAAIDRSKRRLKTLQSNQNDNQKRAADFERTGKKPPKHILDELDKYRRLITAEKRRLETLEIDKKEREKRYHTDFERFKGLKSGRIKYGSL